jgi:regulator of protease activity HflC (stomatin/prohibitin superfamily)
LLTAGEYLPSPSLLLARTICAEYIYPSQVVSLQGEVMLGWKFAKFEPNAYIHVVRKGKAIRKGRGLSFWFFAPTTSIVKIPLETRNLPFVFEETTLDFQTITIQGDLVYKIDETEKVMDQVNFAISTRSMDYLSDDPDKLNQRIINIVKTLAKSEISNQALRDSIRLTDKLAKTLKSSVQSNEYLVDLGIKITNINILSINPNKETARALEAETRENILREADDAVYKRRNSAVEQERKIKENELSTEVAIEEKKRQIMETQIEGQRSIKEKERVILEEELAFKIKQEDENSKLIALSVQNRKTEADIKAYSIAAILEPFGRVDPEILKALSTVGMNSSELIANAFSGIAASADKIGELNISPELLQGLLKK